MHTSYTLQERAQDRFFKLIPALGYAQAIPTVGENPSRTPSVYEINSQEEEDIVNAHSQ